MGRAAVVWLALSVCISHALAFWSGGCCSRHFRLAGYSRRLDGPPQSEPGKKKTGGSGTKAKAADRKAKAQDKPKGESLDRLELEVLSKYGSNAFKDALEEGWEDEDEGEKKSKKRDSKPEAPKGALAQFGMGKFQGFGSSSASSDKSKSKGKAVGSSKASAETETQVGGSSDYELDDLFDEDVGDDDFAFDLDEGDDEDYEVVSPKPRSGVLGTGRLGRLRAPAVAAPASAGSVKSKGAYSSIRELLEAEAVAGRGGAAQEPPRKKERWVLRSSAQAGAGAEEDEDDEDEEEEENDDNEEAAYQSARLTGKRYSVPPGSAAAAAAVSASASRSYAPPSTSTSSSSYSSPPLAAPAAAAAAAPGFRLRQPPPKSREEQDKEAALAARREADEEERKRRRKERKDSEKNEFYPFDFSSPAPSSASDGGDASASGGSGSSSDDRVFSASSFDELLGGAGAGAAGAALAPDVRARVLSNLAQMKMFNPTRVQESALPVLLAGRDAVIHAQTGSGKTLAFLLPLLGAIDADKNKVQAIVLAPSRELVTQTAQVAERLFAGTGVRCAAIIGGANVRGQVDRLRSERPQLLVASPGRLAELVFRLDKLRLGNVRAVVLDEVDNLLLDSFRGDVELLLEATGVGRGRVRGAGAGAGPGAGPEAGAGAGAAGGAAGKSSGGGSVELADGEVYEDDGLGAIDGPEAEAEAEAEEGAGAGAGKGKGAAGAGVGAGAESKSRQFICLASATGNSPAVAAFASRYCRDWQKVALDAASALPRSIAHALISAPRMRALEQLRRLLAAKPEVVSALIFVNDPHRVQVVADQLLDMGLVAAPLHGDSSKDDRKEILTRLRDGRLRLVVCTELAARGLDFPSLTHVVNFELPTDASHYVHRAGRCGRAARKGLVINFANPSTKFVVRRFGKQLGVKIRDCEVREGQVWLRSK